MNHHRSVRHGSEVLVGMVILLALAGCGPAPAAAPVPTASPAPTAVNPQLTDVPTAEEPSPEPDPYPLSGPGPYPASRATYRFEDATRENRLVVVTVWYPAIQPDDSTGGELVPDADLEPDPSGAPYPLILSSTKLARILAPNLVSHGFVWASVDRIDSYAQVGTQAFEQPLDILFALHQVADTPPEGLEGMIDADHAGAIGYSFDGYNALALSGARIDPEYYLAQCPVPDSVTGAVLSELSAFGCNPAANWDSFAGRAGDAVTVSNDGLWQPISDERIRAVMPMAAEGWWLFGERGLAAVDRPILMITATGDELYRENALIFDHLGTPDKTLISFVGSDHMMIYNADMVARMAHFAVAFFGTHLQARADLAMYYSEDFVGQHEDLAWGVYTGP